MLGGFFHKEESKGGGRMNILSWNLNGIKASLNRGDFGQMENLPTLDVICLQETRTHEEPVVLKNYKHHWYHADKKRI